MPQVDVTSGARRDRANWIPLRTIIALRWIAIAGQLIAITVGTRFFALELELGLCFLAIGASVITNLIAAFIYPENKRLSEAEAFVLFAFDILQLSFLLGLTGGLSNPFTLLLIAPFMISAVALKRRTTMWLGALVITLVSLLAVIYVPLTTVDGRVLRIPALFVFGFWSSIVIGTLFLGLYASRVSSEINTMDDAVSALHLALAREQKLTDLSGVVAAAAHELGTPLSTIKLVSVELIEELETMPELQEDARLIRDQADRCRDIMRSMGRAGKDDLHIKTIPFSEIVKDAAEPHSDRGKALRYSVDIDADDGEPSVSRKPEIVHGLRNLIQNAVDFAHETVWIDIGITESHMSVRIADDGPGFSTSVLGRIGDPFVRKGSRSESTRQRPNYEGMGLGLFIAKTLLERTDAEISFANGRERRTIDDGRLREGAIIEVKWPRNALQIVKDRQALGENQLFQQ